ncbi:MAG: DUF1934 domain-containing protein [Lachnospiraceae bacterium]|nr:DUF1934 domain-containing protein [Lachnospiraceae bacterium]
MTKDVCISIRGLNIDSEDSEPLELITIGKYTKKDGISYLRFEEISDEVGEMTKDTLKFSPEGAELIRHGAMEMFLSFLPGEKTVTSYRTPFGMFYLGIDTDSIEISESEDTLDLSIRYLLEANHEFLAKCEISVNVQSCLERSKK